MLTDIKVRSAKPLAKSYKLTDSQGLHLTVSANGAKLWYFRYRFGGEENRLASSRYPQIMLAEASEKRDAARKLLASGLCPSLTRKADNTAVDESRTFQYITTIWHTSCLKLWSDAHADKILTCLKRYVFPAIGAMDIALIETRHPAQLIKTIDDKGVHDVAGRVRQHLTKIMRHAVLNFDLFRTLNEAREITERWLTEYNSEQPHESLNNLTPVEYRLMTEKPEISKSTWD